MSEETSNLDTSSAGLEQEPSNKLFIGGLVLLVVVGVLVYVFFGKSGSQVTEVAIGDKPENVVVTTTKGNEVTKDEVAEAVGEELVVEVSLTGNNFSFSQDEIRVKKGSRVVVEFESVEGFHDFVIDEFDASTEQVRPGTTTSVEFVASEVGTFEYYCSVGNHREQGMVGVLIVE